MTVVQLRLFVIRTLAAAMERVDRASTTPGGGGGGAEYAGVMLFVLKLLVANTDDLARAAPPSAKEIQPAARDGFRNVASAAEAGTVAEMDLKLDRILAREEDILRAVRCSMGPDRISAECNSRGRARRGRLDADHVVEIPIQSVSGASIEMHPPRTRTSTKGAKGIRRGKRPSATVSGAATAEWAGEEPAKECLGAAGIVAGFSTSQERAMPRGVHSPSHPRLVAFHVEGRPGLTESAVTPNAFAASKPVLLEKALAGVGSCYDSDCRGGRRQAEGPQIEAPTWRSMVHPEPNQTFHDATEKSGMGPESAGKFSQILPKTNFRKAASARNPVFERPNQSLISATAHLSPDNFADGSNVLRNGGGSVGGGSNSICSCGGGDGGGGGAASAVDSVSHGRRIVGAHKRQLAEKEGFDWRRVAAGGRWSDNGYGRWMFTAATDGILDGGDEPAAVSEFLWRRRRGKSSSADDDFDCDDAIEPDNVQECNSGMNGEKCGNGYPRGSSCSSIHPKIDGMSKLGPKNRPGLVGALEGAERPAPRAPVQNQRPAPRAPERPRSRPGFMIPS